MGTYIDYIGSKKQILCLLDFRSGTSPIGSGPEFRAQRRGFGVRNSHMDPVCAKNKSAKNILFQQNTVFAKTMLLTHVFDKPLSPK